MSILRVNPGDDVETVCHNLQNGDTLQIGPGLYPDQHIAIKPDDVTVEGVPDANGNRPHFHSAVPEGKKLPPDFHSWGAAWRGRGICVWKGKRGTVKNMEFSGAKSNSFNGAGIRHEGDDLTVINSYFHDNQNGILGSGMGKYWIEGNHFVKNGYGSGQVHNCYIGKCAAAYFLNNVSEASIVGHLFKSRAADTIVYGNQFRDGAGNPSYHLDIEALRAYVVGNTFEKTQTAGPNTLIHFYIWHYAGQPMSLYVRNNRMVAAVNHKGHFLWVDDRIETKVDGKTVYLDPVPGSITGTAKNNVCVFSPALTPKGAPLPTTFGTNPWAVPASFGIDPSNIVVPLGKEPAPAETQKIALTPNLLPYFLREWEG